MSFDSDDPFCPDGACAPLLTRRRLLRLGAGLLPCAALTLVVPWAALAAPARKPAPSGAPAGSGPDDNQMMPARKPRAPRLLMLDPGHGGHDPGAIGRSGTEEKTVTLEIARRMADTLVPYLGVDVKLTRERDVFLPLKERVRLAQAVRADLFVSIHADSAPNSAARGLSVYTLSEKASDQFAKELADRENNADLMGGLDLPLDDQEVAAILYDLTARRTRNVAQKAKVDFVRAMGAGWRLLENPMRGANFAVLRAPDVPSLLIETGFLSNPDDEKILAMPEKRKKIADLMAREIAGLLTSPLFG